MSNFIKKSFVIYMVVMTALLGVAGLVNVADAANVATAGDLIKKEGASAVYYLDASLMRHPFNHSREYFTWYEDFSNVVTVSADEMASYDIGSTVVVRPGTGLVQFVSIQGDGTMDVDDPKVYAVESDGTIRHITSAAVASELYGSNWESRIVPLVNVLKGYYTTGSDLSSATYPTGSLVKMSGSDQVYYIDGMTKRAVTDAGFTANRFNMDYVSTASDLSSYTTGTSVTAMEDSLANPMTGAAGVVAPASGLAVGLAANTPAGKTVPKGATGVVATTYNFTASNDGAATITSLKVQRSGIGAYGDVSKVYIFDGDTRLTTGRTINSDGQASINLNYTVPAGQTKQLSVVFDVAASPTVGDLHNFRIYDIVSNATVTGTTPAGSSFSIGGASAASFTVSDNGDATASVKVGEDGKKLADFDFDTIANEDIAFTRLVMTDGGSADMGDYDNIVLKYNGNALATGVRSGSLITFEFDELTLEKNKSNYNFTVYADIDGGITNTIKLYIDEKSDITAVGKDYGYNANITNTAFDQSSEATLATIYGGEITVNFATDAAETTTGDQEDFVFATLEVTASEDIDVQELRVSIAETDGADGGTGVIDIDNLELHLVETGAVYDGTASTDSDTTDNDPYWDYTNLIWEAGSYTWQIRGDFPAAASTSADSYVVSIDFTSGFVAEYSESNQSVTAASDLSVNTLTGKAKTLGVAGLSVVPASLQNSQAVVNADDVLLAAGSFDTNSNDSVSVTAIKFEGNNDSTTSGALVSLVDDGYLDKTNVARIRFMADLDNNGSYTELDSKTGTSLTNGEVTFDSFDYELNIPADGSIPFKVLMDVTGTLDSASTTMRIQTTSVTARDSNQNSVNVSNVSGTTISATARVDFGSAVSLYANGIITVAQDNTVSGYNRNKYVLAGSDDVPISRLKFTVSYEPITVTQFVVTNNTAAYSDSIHDFELVDPDGTSVLSGAGFGSGTTATSTNDSGLFTIPVGTSYYYLKANLNNIGYGQTETADSQDVLAFYLAEVDTAFEAVGLETGVTLASSDVTMTADTNTKYNSTVVGTKVGSITDLTSQTLTTGEQEIFRFRINLDTSETNGSTTNNGEELRMVLEELAVKLTYGTSAMTSTAVDSNNYLKLYRVGGSGYATASIPVTGSKATFDLDTTTGQGATAAWVSSLVANREISVSDGYAEFYIKATQIDRANGDSGDYVQARIDTIDGSAGTLGTNYDLKWHDGTGNMMYDLLLGVSELVGAPVNP